METYLIKTKAVMEQTYKVVAETREEAERIALENTEDVIEQTVVGEGEVLSVIKIEE